MVKAYLRYEHDGSFGVITSGANPCYDASGKLLITSALENVAVWNLKQGSLVSACCFSQCMLLAGMLRQSVPCRPTPCHQLSLEMMPLQVRQQQLPQRLHA